VGKGSRVRVVVSGGPATVAVADVEGLSVSQALARLRKGGLKPSTRSQASSTVAAGKAIGTDPPAGTELQVGSPVVVLVSSGPATVKVPDVVGQSQAAAEATLANVNLAVGTVTKRETAGSSPGTVVSQAPATGSTAHPGDKVSLVLAEAPTQAEVPTVVGQGEAQAAAALGQAGFKPRTKSQPTSDASQVGIVLRQSPSAGTKLRKGATVTITIGVQGQQTTPTGTTPTSTVPTTPAPPPGG
jgi:serine/threonine-protein kinase